MLAWKGDPDPSLLAHREIRVRIRCKNTALYSIYAGTEKEAKRYWEFRIASFLGMEREMERDWVRA